MTSIRLTRHRAERAKRALREQVWAVSSKREAERNNRGHTESRDLKGGTLRALASGSAIQRL